MESIVSAEHCVGLFFYWPGGSWAVVLENKRTGPIIISDYESEIIENESVLLVNGNGNHNSLARQP